MNPITPNLSKYKVQKSKLTQWNDIVGQFTDRLNLERRGTKWKQLTYVAVGVKLARYAPNKNYSKLYALMKSCEGGEFSKIFFGAIKRELPTPLV